MSDGVLIYLKCNGLNGQCGHDNHSNEFLLDWHDADAIGTVMNSAREASGHYKAFPFSVVLSTVAGKDAANVESETLKSAGAMRKIIDEATIKHFEIVNGAQALTHTYTLNNVTFSPTGNPYEFQVNFTKYKSKKQGYNSDGTVIPSNEVWYDTKTNTSSFIS
ncbi:hypothetical protein [Paludibacterium purpuratum]|uniref:Type VI secretion system secreted protein Hcp n=1 Tax=Paludibacterium purpuratum TaxID=1144873 RepID=A0A4R7B5Z6_9NEIS|nr:hypothetical protein [Paludibacterium purpuratum]TDR78360.1 hypothetical protein DFP86_10877 [Paludibacterium purpuratum]